MKSVPVANLRKYVKVLETFRSLGLTMPTGAMEFFLHAAMNQGASISDIAAACDQEIVTASRYVQELGTPNKRRPDALDLIVAYENPENRRQKIVELTEKGHQVVEALNAA